MTFSPPMAAPLPGAVVMIERMVSPASSFVVDHARSELSQEPLLISRRGRVDPFVDRRSELAREFDIAGSRIDAERRRDFGRQQAEQ